MKKLLIILLSGFSLFVQAQTTNFNFTNKPFSDPELPNYHRGAQYWNGTVWGTGSAPQVPPGNSTSGAKARYQRYWWIECESTQGTYTFTKASLGADWWKSVEASLEWCANNGALFGFGGVMTSYDNPYGVYFDGAYSVYPQYLHNLMQAEATTKDWKYNNGNCWVPNWNSPSYLARFRALNDTLLKFIKNYKITPTSGPWAGKLVEGWKIIDFIDMRGFGNFGEWHTYPWGDDGSEPAFGKATDSTFKKIIDINVDIFGEYPLHIPVGAFDDNSWGEGTAFTTWYALTRQTKYGVIGWRRDNIGDPGLDGFLIGNTFTGPNGWKADTAILARWKYAMITGEPLNGGGTCCPYYYHIRQELNTYHYATFGNGNYGSTAQSVFDSMQVYFKMTGYRYNLNGGSMSTLLAQNTNFDVSLNWRNVGVSPLYQKRWRVVYQLKTAGDVEVKKWVSKFNPYLFLPKNTDSIVAETFNLGNIPVGTTYKLTIKFEDTVGLLSPLFLAINSPTRNSDGSYTLRSNITVTAALPVKWKSFTGTNKNDFIELNWITSCETNNDKFEIEKSTDNGINFIKIGTVKSNGGVGCLDQSYQYKDYNVYPGVAFYRLKQIDIDGNLSYSNTITIRSGINNTLKIFPNPANNNIMAVVNNNITGQTTISMFSSDGKLVRQQNFIKNSNYLSTTFNIDDLAVGIYTIKVTINNITQGVQTLIKK